MKYWNITWNIIDCHEEAGGDDNGLGEHIDDISKLHNFGTKTNYIYISGAGNVGNFKNYFYDICRQLR